MKTGSKLHVDTALPKLDGATEVKKTAPVAAKKLDVLEKSSGEARRLQGKDEPIKLPPSGIGGLSGELGAGALEALADGASPEAKKILGGAIDALRKKRVATPLRLTLRLDKSRPEELDCRIQRSVVMVGGVPTARAQLVPFDRSLHSFPIDPKQIEGLRDGASVTIALEKSVDREQSYVVKADDSAYAGGFVARVVVEGGEAFAVGLESAAIYDKVPLPGAEALAGKTVIVDVENPASPSDRSGKVRHVAGESGGLSEKLLESAIRGGVDVGFSAPAMEQLRGILADPPIVGTDLTKLPFITIDNVGSKDLDQAMCIQRRADGGYDVHYAIADVAAFIPVGSPLDKDMKKRTQTAFMADGQNVPMMPHELSEGVVSLLPNVKRRAFVVSVSLDASGEVTGTKFARGVIQSQAKLAYTQVQAFMDAGAKGDLAGKGWSDNLLLLKELGQKRVKMAEARGVVPSEGEPPSLRLHDGALVVSGRARNDVEKWNEQISLLANEEVGRKLHASGVKALFRTHPEPPPAKLEAFRELVAELGVPWPEGTSLADYVRGLDPKHALTDVIKEHVTRVNVPASYETAWAGGHAGLKLDEYAHFTAPMRRYVDVVDARILAALIEGGPVPYQGPGDKTLEQVQRLAEDARKRESEIAVREANLLQAAYFADKVGQKLDAKIVGVRPSGIVVAIGDSGLRCTVPVSELGAGVAALEKAGTRLSVGDVAFTLGQKLQIQVKNVTSERANFGLG